MQNQYGINRGIGVFLFSVAQLKIYYITNPKGDNLMKEIEVIERKVVLSELLKNYLGLAALIIGGLWAVYTFHKLQSSYSAELDIESKAASRLLLDFDINVMELNSPREDLIGLEVEINVLNQGILPARIDLSKSLFSVVKLKPGIDKYSNPNIGKFYTAEPFSYYNGKSWGVDSCIVALPKVKKSIKYFVQVPEPGYYFVSFAAPVSIDAQKIINAWEVGWKSSSNSTLHIWNTQKYISVIGKISKAAIKKRMAD